MSVSIQLRFGAGQRRRFQVADQRRAAALRALAADCVERKVPPDLAAETLDKAAQCDAATFQELRRIVEGYRSPQPGEAPKPRAKTFQMVGEEWTSGDFRRRYPDQLQREIFQESNIQRLEKAVYPKLGAVLIHEVTREHCDEVMRSLPQSRGKELARTTRRQYAGLMNRILNLAELAGYIDRNPLPRGWLPKPSPKKRYPILYPGEDRALLGCPDVPLQYRLFYGFLHREGMRKSEAAAITWGELDFENGTLATDENKTNHARFWKLAPGVAEALAKWRKLSAKRELGDLVFTLDVEHLATLAREHLKAAGLTRPDLYSRGPNKGRFGTHCFRRSFVTSALARGQTEDWVRQRTGHKSEELMTYRQAAKALAELAPGDLDPLLLAIPEFGGGTEGGTGLLDREPENDVSTENQYISEDGGTGRRARFRF